MEKLAFADYQALGPLETPPAADTIKVLKIGLSVGPCPPHCASMIVVVVVLLWSLSCPLPSAHVWTREGSLHARHCLTVRFS